MLIARENAGGLIRTMQAAGRATIPGSVGCAGSSTMRQIFAIRQPMCADGIGDEIVAVITKQAAAVCAKPEETGAILRTGLRPRRAQIQDVLGFARLPGGGP